MTDEPPRLDAQALRRPVFYGGVPLRLSDGQTWYVPRPSVYTAGVNVDSFLWTLEGRGSPEGFGEIYMAKVQESWPEPGMPGRDEQALMRICELAAFLLRHNYDVSDTDAFRLISLGFAATSDEKGPDAAAALIKSILVHPSLAELEKLRRGMSPTAGLN